ncbi:hypothetical protein BT69DRAFT_1303152 [Atractiella rhizophila]|nr:hypothetical protein BT69DRAFT_1303152 [Atractiella rhizophila]
MVSNFMQKTKLSELPNLDRDEMIEIGQHCTLESCNQLDFLPFKCNKCEKNFCAEHWKVGDHDCPKAGAGDDFRAPECPLCHAPIPLSSPSEDPNVPMSRHLDSLCPILFPSSGAPAKSLRTCRLKGCNKKFIAGTDGILCNGCGERYCISHRFAKDHNCVSLASTSASKSNGSTSSAATGPRQMSAAGLAAMKRAAASKLPSSSKSSAKPPSTSSKPSPSVSASTSLSTPTSASTTTSSAPRSPSSKPSPLSSLSPENRAVKKHVKSEAASAYKALSRKAELGWVSPQRRTVNPVGYAF